MRRRFGMPVALIVVDTMAPTAGFKKHGDENDAVLGARLMKDGFGEIARRTSTSALGVDRFGKTAETGTRGSSGKEDNADVVLATLAEKSMAGVAHAAAARHHQHGTAELRLFSDGPLKAVDSKVMRVESFKQYPAEGDTE
jgi:hypothetical protein